MMGDMAVTVAGAAAPKQASTGRRFVVAAGLASLLPWIIGPVVAHFDFYGGRLTLSMLTVALGTPHVATTLVFYLDREMRPILAEDRMRSVWLPLASIPVVWLAFGALDSGPREVVLIGYVAWQLHHVGRQNLGMFSFVCMARGLRGPSDRERLVFRYAGWAGIAGFLPTIGVDVLSTGALRVLAGVLVAAAAVEAVKAQPTDPVRAGALGMGVLFFVPLVVFTNPVAATVGFSAAHGAQYLLMMGYLRNGRGTGAAAVTALVVLGLWVAGGWALEAMQNGPVPGLALALAGAHFAADARLWKAKRPSQRAYMARRFPFLAPA